MKHPLTFVLNGEPVQVHAAPNVTLLDLLRRDLGLTGTKQGCGEGDCGACTVLVDGEPVSSCLVLALEIQGRQVVTIEGIAHAGELHPVQRAFVEHGAIQCGFCTPGMILVAKALLDRVPAPGDLEIREAIAGNLCRCTGYQKIVEAVTAAAQRLASNP